MRLCNNTLVTTDVRHSRVTTQVRYSKSRSQTLRGRLSASECGTQKWDGLRVRAEGLNMLGSTIDAGALVDEIQALQPPQKFKDR